MLRRRFARILRAALAALVVLSASASSLPSVAASPASASGTSDVAAARAVFDRNLNAIRARDRAAYLACYLENAENFIRTGETGLVLGWAEFAKQAGSGWPDTFEASDLELVLIRPGLVYGTYRYRVRYGTDEQTGVSERLFVDSPGGWKITLTGAYLARPETPAPRTALVGGTLLDGTGAPPVVNATVVLAGGKIECAGKGCAVPKGSATVDARGLWITPGLVDAHVHFSQTGWADGRPDALDVRDRFPYEKTQADLRAHPERFFRSQLCSGVTAVFDVGGYAWNVSMAHAAQGSRAPHVAAAGPLLSTLDHWLNLPAERQFMHLKDVESARTGVAYLKAIGADAVKVWYIVQPDMPVEKTAPFVLAAGEEAKKAGLPLIVHATGLAEAKAALKAGARLLVHGVWDLPVDEEFLSLAKANGTIYCPTMTVAGGYVVMNRAAVTGTPPPVDNVNGCVDPTTLAHVALSAQAGSPVSPGRADRLAQQEKRTADAFAIGAANLKRVVAAGIPVAMGTDAGNPLTLHGPSVFAEMEAMQAAGMSPMQVLVASTRGGARAMGRDSVFGTVEKGKDADLVVVAADPSADIKNLRQLRYVVRAGVVRSAEELSAVVAAGKW